MKWPNHPDATPSRSRPESRLLGGDAERSENPPRIWQVGELVRRITYLIEEEFPEPIWVEGEITNLRRQPQSGHMYFSLMDADTRAQIQAVWFQSRQSPNAGELKDGQRVRVWGEIGTYEPRSEYQIRVWKVEPAGRGALLEALERLKKKLAAEGLFDPARKRSLPRLPRGVGVVTSPTGAALRDIVRTIRRRFPNMRIVVAPCRVQGQEAPAEIVRALGLVGRCAAVDVVIVARGGGSVEDLWAFNDEAVVRAVAACPLPVVSGVGHETDETLTDFAADLRASTPTAAAELVVPDRSELEREVAQWSRRLSRSLQHARDVYRERLHRARNSLHYAVERSVGQRRERVTRLQDRLRHRVQDRMARWRQHWDDLGRRAREALRVRASRARERLQAYPVERLSAAVGRIISGQRSALGLIDARLRSLDPREVLRRGYSITQRADGRVVTSVTLARTGEFLVTFVRDGRIESTVQAVHSSSDPTVGTRGPGSTQEGS